MIKMRSLLTRKYENMRDKKRNPILNRIINLIKSKNELNEKNINSIL